MLIDGSCLAPTASGQPAPTQGTAEAAAAQGSANRLMGGRTVRFDLTEGLGGAARLLVAQGHDRIDSRGP